MTITYNNTKKDLPSDQLYTLFLSAGWASSNASNTHKTNLNIGHINSTLVISAWDNQLLVGAVRVLGDTIFRSVIYDLIVHPDYQNQGIGKELINRCLQHYPTSEWQVQTTPAIAPYYQKLGFQPNTSSDNFYLKISSKYF